MDYKICPNCNKKLNGFMATRHIVTKNITSLINEHRAESAEAYCSDCVQPFLAQYNEATKVEKARLQEIIKSNIKIIPIITAQSPLNWDYSVLSMVSAQTVTGTGLLLNCPHPGQTSWVGSPDLYKINLAKENNYVEISYDTRPLCLAAMQSLLPMWTMQR